MSPVTSRHCPPRPSRRRRDVGGRRLRRTMARGADDLVIVDVDLGRRLPDRRGRHASRRRIATSGRRHTGSRATWPATDRRRTAEARDRARARPPRRLPGQPVSAVANGRPTDGGELSAVAVLRMIRQADLDAGTAWRDERGERRPGSDRRGAAARAGRSPATSRRCRQPALDGMALASELGGGASDRVDVRADDATAAPVRRSTGDVAAATADVDAVGRGRSPDGRAARSARFERRRDAQPLRPCCPRRMAYWPSSCAHCPPADGRES